MFKGNGSRSDRNNYRQISVLPVLPKLLERHICEHLCDFFKSNGIFYKLQSGFGKSFSTETALIQLIDELLHNLDMDNVTGLVMIEYKKAFDFIDHALRLQKLRATGIDNDYFICFTLWKLSEWSYAICKHRWVSFNSQRFKPWSASREYTRTSFVSYIGKRSTKDTGTFSSRHIDGWYCWL